MERTALNIWVGLFVVGGFIALLVLALKVGNLGAGGLSDTYTVTAHFQNIGGLKERAPVRSAGVVVGRVTGIHFDTKTYDAAVTMALARSYPFPKDTIASILTSGILGENYVGLDAGGDDVMLKNGDTFKLTQSAVVLEKIIGQFLFNKAQEAPAGGGKAQDPPAARAPEPAGKAPDAGAGGDSRK